MSAGKSKITVTTKLASREIVFERMLNAPRELVFKAYSEPAHLERWWGPKDWRTSTLQMDFRPGGLWHFSMSSPDGQMKPCAKFSYQEIVIPERIRYIESFVDELGNEVGDIPERKVTVLFEDHDGQTKLVMVTEFATVESLQAIVDMGMVQGFTENFDRLGEYLQSVG